MSIEDVTREALQLSMEERAELAHRLLLSLDEPTEDELDELWNTEAERRLKDYREGHDPGVPGDEVFRSLRDRLAH